MVPMAAPATPSPAPTMSTASSTMFTTPATTVTPNAMSGLPAVIMSSWNRYCKMVNGTLMTRMDPYTMPSSSIWPLAPSATSSGRSVAVPRMANAMPPKSAANTSMENRSLASLRLPLPSVLATMALPPVPSMKPSEPRMAGMG